jgi:hypothetical protein
MKSFILAALCATALAGCATSTGAPVEEPTPATELVYRTGSHIPIRDRTPMTKEEREKQAADSQRSLQQMQSTGAGIPKSN